MKRFFIGCCLSLLFSVSPRAVGRQFPRAALQADLDTLYQTLQEVHPDIFAIAGRARLDSMVAALHARIAAADSLAFGTFYQSLIPFFEAIGDGHTRLPVASPSNKNAPVFPFDVFIPDDSTLQVRHNYLPDSPFPGGSRIDSINGCSAREIIRTSVALSPGERMHFRLAYMAPEFYRYYRLFYADTTFRIQAVKPDGTVCRDTVSGIPYRKMINLMAAEITDEPFRFEILSDTVALFDFQSMGNQYKERFMPFLDSMFRILRERKIPHLIIDIRENGGGNSALGNSLMRYISRQPFTQFGTVSVKRSAQVVQANMAHYRNFYPKDFTDEAILQDRNAKEPFGTTFTYRARRKNFIRPMPRRARYRGKVWLLTSHRTFSSATDLSWAFKYFGMGTVVGEETGGMAVSFGDMITLRMPNTRLPYMVSYKKFYTFGATDEDVHGTLPDYPVPADRALDYTLELIRDGHSETN